MKTFVVKAVPYVLESSEKKTNKNKTESKKYGVIYNKDAIQKFFHSINSFA